MSSDLMTIRDVLRHFPGIELHALKHAIARADIQAARRVGIIRMFSPDQLPAIERALRSTSRRPVTRH